MTTRTGCCLFLPAVDALPTLRDRGSIDTMLLGLPLLLLDVDGVLNPFAAPACPAGYHEYHLFPNEDPVRLCHAHGHWLQELAVRFEIVWATAWGADANRLLTPLLHLSKLPVIRFPPAPFEPYEKVPPIAAFVGKRPTVWIDDALTPVQKTCSRLRGCTRIA